MENKLHGIEISAMAMKGEQSCSHGEMDGAELSSIKECIIWEIGSMEMLSGEIKQICEHW